VADATTAPTERERLDALVRCLVRCRQEASARPGANARALRAEIDEVLAFVGFRWDRETGTTSEKPRA